MKSQKTDDLFTLQQVLALLQPLDVAVQQRIVQTVITFLELETPPVSIGAEPNRDSSQPQPFSLDRTLSIKDFLLQKRPLTDIERVACLAYYITHYKNSPYFKTVDLSVLNTEGAQPKFSNISWTTSNALKRGLLAPASGGNRQLSASGEKFVEALPDREAAAAALAQTRSRRKKSSSKKKKSTADV